VITGEAITFWQDFWEIHNQVGLEICLGTEQVGHLEEVDFLEKGNLFPNYVENGVKSEVVGRFIEQKIGEDEIVVFEDNEGEDAFFLGYIQDFEKIIGIRLVVCCFS